MSEFRTFWTVPNGRAAVELRRVYEPPGQPDDRSARPCPAHPEWDYHWAKKRIGEVACELRPDPRFDGTPLWWFDYPDEKPATEDPRWPTECDCGLVFPLPVSRGHLHLDREPLFVGAHDGIARPERAQPVGALWRSPYYEHRALPHGAPDDGKAWARIGPDGWCVAIMTPGGEWGIDHRSRDGGFWTRTAVPADVKPGDFVPIVASPSILIGTRYHGFLGGSAGQQPGILVSC